MYDPCSGKADEGESKSRTSRKLYVSGKGKEKNSVAQVPSYLLCFQGPISPFLSILVLFGCLRVDQDI